MNKSYFWWRIRKYNSLFLCLCGLAYFHLDDNPFLRVGSMEAEHVREFYGSVLAQTVSIFFLFSLLLHTITSFFFKKLTQKANTHQEFTESKQTVQDNDE